MFDFVEYQRGNGPAFGEQALRRGIKHRLIGFDPQPGLQTPVGFEADLDAVSFTDRRYKVVLLRLAPIGRMRDLPGART